MPVLRSIGQNPTEEEILNLVIEYDVNGDGTIDFEEFLEMMMKHSKGFYIHLLLTHIILDAKIIFLKKTKWEKIRILSKNSHF